MALRGDSGASSLKSYPVSVLWMVPFIFSFDILIESPSVDISTKKFVCLICDKTTEADQRMGPPGWRMRTVNGTSAELCDACGDDAAWNGGPSPRIKRLYLERHGEELRGED